MTNELLNKQESKLLFLDIETASLHKELDVKSEEFRLWQYKNRDRQTDKLPTTAETKKLYKTRAALNPLYGQVVAVTIGFIHNDKIILKTFKGKEKDILRNVVDLLNNNVGKEIIIWNKDFDMPFLRKRFFVNKLENYLSDAIGNDSMKKPWTLKGVVDLMEVWKGISYYNDSLDEVAVALGVESPKQNLKGSEVSEAFWKGKIDNIASYCEDDVIALINVFRVMTYKSIITEVERKNDEVTKVGLIDKIKNTGRYTKALEKEVLKKARSLGKEEKLMLVDLVNSALALNKQKLTEEQKNKINDKIR